MLFGLCPMESSPFDKVGLVNNKEFTISKNISTLDSSSVVLFFDDGFYSVYQYVYPLLKKYKMTASLGIIASYVKNIMSIPNRAPNSFMTQNELQELIDSLSIEIASHSVSHTRLIEIQDTMLIKYELTVSKKILELLFKQKIITFVYPYGKYDDRILRMTSEAGYLIGRTCDFGDPNFWIGRLRVPIKEVRDTTSVKVIIDHIKKHDQTVLLFHKIVPTPKTFTEYSVSRFDSILSMLDTMEVRVLTLRDLYNEWCQEVLETHLKNFSRIRFGQSTDSSYGKQLFQDVDIDRTRTPSRF